MSRPPPPQYFPRPFANPGAESNPRSVTRGATQPTAGYPAEPATYHSQVPNGGTYLPQQPEPHISLQSSAPPPVRRSTRPPASAPASALTQSYSSSPQYSSGTAPSFPIPAVPGGYGVPSNPSCLVPPPSLPMTERTTTTYGHNVQVGYQTVAVPGVPHQRPTAMGWSHQDVGSSSHGNQGSEQSPDMTGNMNDYAKERGRPSLPFAGGGRRQRTNRAEEQVPQPNLLCISCRGETPPDEHARLGGFCSERHKWEWDSNQNQNQARRMP